MAGWALGLAAASLVLYVAAGVLAASNLLKELGPEPTLDDVRRLMQEQSQRASPPPGSAASCVGIALTGVLWIAGVACGVVALGRPGGRGKAVGALAICGTVLLLVCAGPVLLLLT